MTRFLLIIFLILKLTTCLTSGQEPGLVKFVDIQTNSVKIELPDSIGKISDYIAVIRHSDTKAISPNEKLEYLPGKSYLSYDSATFTGDGNFVIYNKGINTEISYSNLVPDTYYNIDFYTKVQNKYKLANSVKFTTLAEKPERQTKRLMWYDPVSDTLKLFTLGGSGSSRLIAMSKLQSDFIPVAGHSYRADLRLGKGAEPADGLFVVSASDDTTGYFEITGLESGAIYYVYSFEYNGMKNSSNYNTETGKMKNVIRIATVLPRPVITSVVDAGEGNIRVKWNPINGVTTYLVEIAEDPEFNKYHHLLKGEIDVGGGNEANLIECESNKDYYIRVKATNSLTSSEYSETHKIRL